MKSEIPEIEIVELQLLLVITQIFFFCQRLTFFFFAVKALGYKLLTGPTAFVEIDNKNFCSRKCTHIEISITTQKRTKNNYVLLSSFAMCSRFDFTSRHKERFVKWLCSELLILKKCKRGLEM